LVNDFTQGRFYGLKPSCCLRKLKATEGDDGDFDGEGTQIRARALAAR
jgi:hypothetical protein